MAVDPLLIGSVVFLLIIGFLWNNWESRDKELINLLRKKEIILHNDIITTLYKTWKTRENMFIFKVERPPHQIFENLGAQFLSLDSGDAYKYERDRLEAIFSAVHIKTESGSSPKIKRAMKRTFRERGMDVFWVDINEENTLLVVQFI